MAPETETPQNSPEDNPQNEPTQQSSPPPARLKYRSFEQDNVGGVRRSALLKLMAIAVLGLLLLIPTGMIQSLITDRQDVENKAKQEVSADWSGTQAIDGPMLVVPYRVAVKTADNQLTYDRLYARFFPENLTITGNVTPQILHRGIHRVPVYNSKLVLNGTFTKPDFSQLGVKAEDVLWQEAKLSLDVSDLRGITDAVSVNWSGTQYAFQPGLSDDRQQSLIAKPIVNEIENRPSNQFQIALNLKGSEELNFIPLGKQTEVHLTSPWNAPSFEGHFLPFTRTISDHGFTADWKVLEFNHSLIPSESSFGVAFIEPVNNYRVATRTIKYAMLFIGLTFVAFFLVEILNHMKLHPIQYLLVGFAIVLFYMLLLSFSEELPFGWAYFIGSVGIVSLITLYIKAIIRRWSIAGLFFGILSALYGYLYVLIQLEDYALILGSIGLFGVLALVMYLTRRVNWYELSFAKT